MKNFTQKSLKISSKTKRKEGYKLTLAKILPQLKTKFSLKNLTKSDLSKIKIADLALDSRLVKKNDIFIALPGKTADGSKFIASAIENGAALIVTSENKISHPALITAQPFDLLVELLQKFYPKLPQNIYAITGTNGKTSTAEFTRQILELLGKKSASIGTLGINCDEKIQSKLQNSALTTPDIISLYRNLATLKKHKIDDVAIEVSSIGLEQQRVAGINISVGAFTNFTQDHLDYHKNMQDYFACKMLLFSSVLGNKDCAIINSDIPEFSQIKKICTKNKLKVTEYGLKAKDLHLEKTVPTKNGQKVFFIYQKQKYQFDLQISGQFQAMNMLCALGNVLAKKELDDKALKNLLKKFPKIRPALGRMQEVTALKNGAKIFIDFAHSPDSLENTLKLARKMTDQRVLILFGCGGDRDAKKRPIMGKIASDLADLVIVTDDNPRTENPATIRQEIIKNCNAKKTVEISDRKEAIAQAIKLLEKNDLLILAGKGHEKYQIIGTKKLPFDEEKIVRNFVEK
jgi:UDP-N-acetylmuramoyl-L-alanyl-D-glutamate--2,6-diaminopimelate ligase